MKLSARHFFIFFALWAALLSFEYWGFGENSYIKMPDSGDGHLAARLSIGENIAAGENGYWNADLWGGTDKKAQSDNLGIFDTLFIFLPGWLASGFYIFLQRFIAGFFTFLLLRNHLKVSMAAAVLPAMLYAFYPAGQYNLQFDGFTHYDALGLPGIPMYLYVLGELAKPGHSVLKQVALGFGLGFFFADASQYKYTIFFVPLLLLWPLLIYPGYKKFSWWPLLAFGLGWASLEIFELGSALLISSSSQRQFRESCYGVSAVETLTLWQFTTKYVLTSSYLPGVMLGVLGAATWSKSPSHRRNLWLVGFLLIYMFGAFYLPAIICSSYNPFGHFKGFTYVRFYIYIPFVVALLYSIGLHNVTEWSKEHFKGEQGRWLFVTLTAGLLIFLFNATLDVKRITLADRANGSNYANLYQNPYLRQLAEYAKETGGPYRAVTIAVDENAFNPHPAFLWTYGLNTTDGYFALFSQRFMNYWLGVLDPMVQQIPECRYYLKLLQGNSRIWLSTMCDTGEVIEVTDDLSKWFDMELLSLTGTRYFVSSFPIYDPKMRPLVTEELPCEAPGCTRYYVYENNQALPHVFAVGSTIVAESREQVMDLLAQATAEDLANIAFLATEDTHGLALDTLGLAPAILQVSHYSSDVLQIRLQSSEAKLLVLNRSIFPSWRAWVDGKETPIVPVDELLMGVLVPAGEHVVTFEYLPPYTLHGVQYRLAPEKYLPELVQ
ncbi:MAG: YfhO family protein [Anaerolineales bacterium]|nr:YfhO family protein [Anaerolineales bacterium]